MPTLADLCGVDIKGSKPLDGVSLKPLLESNPADWPDRGIYSLRADGKNTGVRTDRYRAGGDAGGLFDMLCDPGQRTDLAQAEPERYTSLMRGADEWREEATARQFVDRPLPVGYPEFPRTDLAAQDGLPSGEITWSSIHPNASYFVDWTRVEDSIRWELDVKTSGSYEVSLFYACPEGDEGAELEAQFKGERVRCPVQDAFESPLKDQDDRVKRAEAYDREFRELTLGRMGMDQGKGDFTLRALSKKGEGIVDVRGVRVRLLQ
jgi:hypothetical protein